MAEQISLEKTLELLFDYTSKTIVDLKSREWQATALALAGIAGVYTFARNPNTAVTHGRLIWVMAGVVSAYLIVMSSCIANLNKFRPCLREIGEQHFPRAVQDLFKRLDEGRIEVISFVLVFLAFAFAARDIWPNKHGQ